jgi:hypothetical protein
MPIAASDIDLRLSGGAGNPSATTSLGGAKSSVAAGSSVFGSFLASEAAAGRTEYRCLYVHNGHSTLTAENVRAWVSSNTPGAQTTIDIGVGSSAVNGVEQVTGNEIVVPTGVTFYAASTLAAALALGNIPPGQHRAIWLRLTVTAGAAADPDEPYNIRIELDSEQ